MSDVLPLAEDLNDAELLDHFERMFNEQVRDLWNAWVSHKDLANQRGWSDAHEWETYKSFLGDVQELALVLMAMRGSEVNQKELLSL